MKSKYGKPIVTNSSLQLLLKQSPASIDIIKETFNLTEREKYMLLESAIGEGILFAGNKHVAIQVVASYTEDQIITSDPAQLLEIEKAKKELAEEEENEERNKITMADYTEQFNQERAKNPNTTVKKKKTAQPISEISDVEFLLAFCLAGIKDILDGLTLGILGWIINIFVIMIIGSLDIISTS